MSTCHVQTGINLLGWVVSGKYIRPRQGHAHAIPLALALMQTERENPQGFGALTSRADAREKQLVRLFQSPIPEVKWRRVSLMIWYG